MEFLNDIFVAPFVDIFNFPVFFAEVVIAGVLTGVMYSLVALGFVLIFKASQVFNFAQGAMVLFAALSLVGLIEAAPTPMWFRNADMELQLVNKAYVAAVGADDAQSVIDQQIELVEAVLRKVGGLIVPRAEPVVPKGDQRLDQHRGLDRHVQRTGYARALQRLVGIFLAQRHQARHFGFGNGDFIAAVFGQRNVLDDVIGEFGHVMFLNLSVKAATRETVAAG